jgi:hypothetical protein
LVAVGTFEGITRIALDCAQRVRIGGVSQLVDIKNGGAEFADKQPADRRADEASAAGNQNPHPCLPGARLLQ